MADDTLMRSQQFAAPFQAQATQRKFDIYEGVARGQQTAFNQVLAVQEMQERSKANAVHTAIEEAKLAEYVKRNQYLSMELDLKHKTAVVGLAIAETQKRMLAMEEDRQKEEVPVTFLGQPMEMNGEWVKFMPGAGGKVDRTKPSDEEIALAKREAHAEHYQRGGSPAVATPRHPSLRRSSDVRTLGDLGKAVTVENLQRIEHELPLLDTPLTEDEKAKRRDWAMKYAQKHAQKRGLTTDAAYRLVLDGLDTDQALYAAFADETKSR
jgi:hypothetical protein